MNTSTALLQHADISARYFAHSPDLCLKLETLWYLSCYINSSHCSKCLWPQLHITRTIFFRHHREPDEHFRTGTCLYLDIKEVILAALHTPPTGCELHYRVGRVPNITFFQYWSYHLCTAAEYHILYAQTINFYIHIKTWPPTPPYREI